MSKGLKSLEFIKECPIYDPYQDSNSPDPSYTSLIKKESYLRPYFRDVEKELKALEILVEKTVNINKLYKSFYAKSVGIYNKSVIADYRKLTQEEYELLKEIMLWLTDHLEQYHIE